MFLLFFCFKKVEPLMGCWLMEKHEQGNTAIRGMPRKCKNLAYLFWLNILRNRIILCINEKTINCNLHLYLKRRIQ